MGVLECWVSNASAVAQLLCRFQIAESIRKYHVTTKRTKDTKVSEILHFNFLTSCSLRRSQGMLSDLRGENVCFVLAEVKPLPFTLCALFERALQEFDSPAAFSRRSGENPRADFGVALENRALRRSPGA